MDSELKKLLDWARSNSAAMRGHHATLFLEQEGGRSEFIPVDTKQRAMRDTVCQVAVTPNVVSNQFHGRIEITSKRDLSAFVRYANLQILYVLGETAFLGLASDAIHDSDSDQYTIVGIVASFPKSEVCGAN
jgi:hypothetical protein